MRGVDSSGVRFDRISHGVMMPSLFDDRIFREASHLNGFSGSLIERWSEARDEASFATALAAADAAIYLFLDDRALLRADGERLAPLFTRNEAEPLGLDPESL